MTLNTTISFLSAIISWALAIFLGTQLLSGTFEGRSCTTSCVNIVFWVSFAIAVIGLIFSFGGVSIGKSNWIKALSLFALIGLVGIYVTTMLIGNFDLL
ncbi:MAG: hypothetical protein KJO81_09240 [Gammaproteobacteria bacterium]|nr:hypothetical protein [Gammaproteobacteria bacterium]MBT8124994.1 hypothetical protein [Gammaproteobacteria bacterium]NNC67800.1 hypothetical protein [Gammaproteobacteria bacterium]